MFGCVVVGVLYVVVATPVYVATARVAVEQNGPRMFEEGRGGGAEDTESYLQTQAEAMKSVPVVARALDAVGYRTMRTFAGATGDPVEWLRRAGTLKIEAPRKADVITVSMESPSPGEAAAVANAVVDAFVVESGLERRRTGERMVEALRKEKAGLEREREARLASMVAYKTAQGVFSFREEKDRGNAVLDRTQALAGTLTQAEVATIELRAQQQAIRQAMGDPRSLRAYVHALQSKGRDSGDGEYDQLRRELVQSMVALARIEGIEGPGHPRRQALEGSISSLEMRIAEKERSIATAALAEVSAQLSAAEAKQAQVREALRVQQASARGLGEAGMEYAKLEADAERLLKRCEVLDRRIDEVTLEHTKAGVLNVRVLEPARPPERPAKPRKLIVLAAACMAGLVLGIGVAMLREFADARLRSPEEIAGVLAVRVLGTIPRLNGRLSPVARGRLTHLDARSPGAEAYHGLRTALQLGVARDARTVLVCSPTSGDGRSTTASNLAIALAQSGSRTLLLDCDLRAPVQHMIFEVDGSPGLTDLLSGAAGLDAAVRPTMTPGLYVLPCGPVPANPSELLTSARFAGLMQALAAGFDRVVIDSAALVAVTDADVLAAGADATLLVCRMNQSTRPLLGVALERLERVGANLVGAVANDVPGADRHLGHSGRGVWQYATSAKRLEAAAAAASTASGQKWTGGDGRGNGRASGHAPGLGDGHVSGAGKPPWDGLSTNVDRPNGDAPHDLQPWGLEALDFSGTGESDARDPAP
jgi:capsular exopolysaccharide synthesis family protein